MERRRTQRAAERDAAEAAAAEEVVDGLDNDDDMQVVGPPELPEDEYDATFGNNANFANIDLPSDNALTERDAILLDNLNKKLQELEFQSCDQCYEEGFELRVEGGKCVSCRNEKGTAKWSFENKTQLGNRPNDEHAALYLFHS